jgi:CubicO group peptidase (beta-lactamase class C family)
MTMPRVPFLLMLICLSARGACGVDDALDAYIRNEMQARRIPGLTFAVIDDGRVRKRAYGRANLETDAPVRTDSIFELASITKPFTATAIMMLVEQGMVSLGDAIGKYLEQAPETWRGMTVRHLLTHTSGLPEHAFNDCMNTTTQQQFAAVVKASLLFPPGEAAQYSDPGYFLLGMIIEKVSGQKYADFFASLTRSR